MAITDDLRKTLSDPTPLYFAAGTADLALRQARKVPSLVEQLRAEAPARIEAVRGTDPKVVQERATTRVRETQESVQARVTELIGGLDTDLKRLGETAQDLALRGVGRAAEYAVRARETYERVAEHGEQAVKTWRGEAAEEIEELAIAVEPKAEPKPKPEPVRVTKPAEGTSGARTQPSAAAKKPNASTTSATANKATPRKTTPKTAAKKTTPPAK